MTSPSKIKGSAWERAVVAYLIDHGFPHTDRRYGAGATADKGDIIGVPGIVVECKNTKTITLAEFMDEAEHERANANADLALLVVKRRNKSAADAYAIVSLAEMTKLLRAVLG